MAELKDTITVIVEYYTGKEEGYPDQKPGYTAHCADIGLVTEGDTFEELLANLQEALELSLEDTDYLATRSIHSKPRVMLSMELPYHAQTA